MANQPPSFEEVFRFKEPTSAQIDESVEAMHLKFNHGGDPIGTQAFFSVSGLQDASMEYIGSMAEQLAVKHKISDQDAAEIVYTGFIGALEFMATLRQRTET